MNGYESHRWMYAKPRAAMERYYWGRRRLRGRLRRWETTGITVNGMFSRKNVFDCLQLLGAGGDTAPGVDGVALSALDRIEQRELSEHIAKCVRNGSYYPQPTREQPIPKHGTEEMRIIKIPTLGDRLVAKVLQMELDMAFDKVFLNGSWGFRMKRGMWKMLAALEATMTQQNLWVLAIDDVRKAFDNVQIDDALEGHRELFETELKEIIRPNEIERILDLISKILRGDQRDRQIGIDQGNPYSPVALNVVLHLAHDRNFTETELSKSWNRYADNLVYACRSITQGHHMLNRTSRLLRPHGLELKGGDGVVDLKAGNMAHLLGFTLKKRGNQLEYDLGEHSLDHLAEHLEQAHSTTDPGAAAKQSIRHWITSYGPAFGKAGLHISKILHTAAQYGFRETWVPGELLDVWRRAWERWQRLRTAAMGSGGTLGEPLLATPSHSVTRTVKRRSEAGQPALVVGAPDDCPF